MTKRRGFVLFLLLALLLAAAVLTALPFGKPPNSFHPVYFSFETLGELALHSDAIFVGTALEVHPHQTMDVGTRQPLLLDYTIAEIRVGTVYKWEGDVEVEEGASVRIKEPEFYDMTAEKIEPGREYLFFVQTYLDKDEPFCLANPDEGKLEIREGRISSSDLSRKYGLEQIVASELTDQLRAEEERAAELLTDSMDTPVEEPAFTEREQQVLAIKEEWAEGLDAMEEAAKADGTFDTPEYWRAYQEKIDELMARLDEIPD